MPFQDLFHSPLGVLFHLSLTVLYAIDHTGVFRLRGWFPYLPTIYSWYSYNRPREYRRDLKGAITRSGMGIPPIERSQAEGVLYGLYHVRSPLLAISRLMSLPPATEMFQLAGSLGHWSFLQGDPWVSAS